MALAQAILSSEKPLALYFGAAGIAVVAIFVIRCLYNLFWHPLRKIPGPRIAAMTGLYEFWYDVVLDGQYLWQVGKMHDKYGPIVRVTPREVHIRDSDYHGTIYSYSHIADKDGPVTLATGLPNSVVTTTEHFHHRSRRGYLNPYFSKREIINMEDMIHERTGRLCGRLGEAQQTGQIVGLDSAFSALTADLIIKRFYGYHMDYLGIDDFHIAVTDAFLGASLIAHFARFFPRIAAALKRMPLWLLKIVQPPMAELQQMQEDTKSRISSLIGEYQKDDNKANRSVLLQALNDKNIPPAERELGRLLDEGMIIIFAGTETTSRVLSFSFFYMLRNKTLLHRLREELRTLPPRRDHEYSLAELERLPFLSGVVREGMRLSFGPIVRSPRLFPRDTMQYNQYSIPPGTPISQSTYFVHTDPEVFPDPWTFNPDRWIEADKNGFPLNRYLVNFTKGTRNCIGQGLAFTECYVVLARLVLTYDMELWDTTPEDISFDIARFTGFPKKAGKSRNERGEIKVKITGRVDQ